MAKRLVRAALHVLAMIVIVALSGITAQAHAEQTARRFRLPDVWSTSAAVS